jgi:hypothetical protein
VLVNETQTNKQEVLIDLKRNSLVAVHKTVFFILKAKKNHMKLPVIKHLTQFIEENDEDYLIETIEVLEAMTEIPSER